MRGSGAFWMAVAAVALLLGLNAGTIPLLDPDEARFARTSVEMLRSGDPVVPRFEGQPRLVKPPLLHWVQSASFSALGITAWVARLPALLATLGSVLLTGWIARRRFGQEAAVWAAACLGTMPMVIAAGHVGTLDALLAVHVLAVVALDLGDTSGATRYAPLALGAILGLAFLIKGPVGVVLPLVIMLAGRTAAGMNLVPGWGATLQAVAGWCLTVLPWGLAFLSRVGSDTALSVVRSEALERYFAGTDHVEPPLFYLKVAAVGFLAWLAPLLVSLVRVVRLGRDPASRCARYAAAGLVAGLVFFSLGKSKVASYMLPLAPLAALLVVWELGRELDQSQRRNWGARLLTAALGLLAVALGLAGGLRLEDAPRTLALIGATAYAVGTAGAVWGLARKRPRAVYGSAAASAGAFLLAAVLLLLPVLARTNSAAYLVERVPELRSGRNIAVVDMKVPSLTFYLDRVPEQLPLAHLDSRLDRADDTLYVLADVDLPQAPAESLARLREVGRQGKYRVYELDAP